jgi:hypothetical protein
MLSPEQLQLLSEIVFCSFFGSFHAIFVAFSSPLVGLAHQDSGGTGLEVTVGGAFYHKQPAFKKGMC